jgi:hypothetical protein
VSRLSEARAALHAELVHVFDAPVNGLSFSSDRAHQWPAAQPVAPCLWIEQPYGTLDEVGQLGTVLVDAVTFPVAVVYDGADRAQVAGLDELVGRTWDLAWRAGRPVSFRPGSIDVGGPSLRATFVQVEMRIAAVTFCEPALITAEEVPVG